MNSGGEARIPVGASATIPQIPLCLGYGTVATARQMHAIAGRTDWDAPGTWPPYAERLCNSNDRELVNAFWLPRAGNMSAPNASSRRGSNRSICTALRIRAARSVTAFLAQYH